MQPTVGRVVLVKYTSGEGHMARLAYMQEGQEYPATVVAVGGVLDVNINTPFPGAPIVQGKVPVKEDEVSPEGLSWRWPPRS